jgi:hypothetical protein
MQHIYNEFRKYIFVFLFLGVVTFVFGQKGPTNKYDQARNSNSKTKQFEGKIRFVQETMDDTLFYTYYVKDGMVRVDAMEEYKNGSSADNYMLFNLQNSTITAVKISRKMYINVPPKPYVDNKDQNYQIIKSNNNKKIKGYKCYQWRVKNKAQNTEVSYWVAQDNFLFFEDFLRLWNRSEKHAVYFLQIPETIGYFPMLSEERTTLREQKMTLRVTEISKQELDPSIFNIPAEYKSYDH